jgi:ABC-type glycerol-3-phosphate transport system substrate-binding protein
MLDLAHRVDRRLAVALLSLIVVTACAFAPTSANPAVTLTIWVDTPPIGASLRQRIQPFMHDHPDITVNVFDQVGKIQNGDISIAIEALTNTELQPDVVALTDTDFRLMSNRADLLNLDPYIIENSDFQSDDFFPNTLEGFRDRGKQYAIASEVVPWVVYYNKDLFDHSHLDYPDLSWTSSQFLTSAEYIAGSQTSESRNQTVGFIADPTQAILPFMESYGVQPVDPSDDPYARWLGDRRAAAALQWYADLGLRQAVMPTDTNPRELGLWFTGRAGMSAMYMDQRNNVPQFFQRDFGTLLTPTTTATMVPQTAWKFGWGVTTLPKAETQTTVFYVSGYGIPSVSPHPDESWLLIDYLTRNLPDRPGRAYVPSRESLAYSTAFANLYPETGRQAYTQSILIGHRLPALPPAAALTQDDVGAVLLGEVHPASALQAYRDRIQPLLLPFAAQPTVTPTPNNSIMP